MGPGYFPMLLGGVLAFLGIVLVVRSLVIAGEPVTRVHIVPLAVIAIGVCLFGLLIEKLGLVIALIAATVVAALAGRGQRPVELAALTLVLALFSVGIFVYALRLPLPVWPSVWG
jgi:putative tricarboxylic transport membrane protein